MISSHLIPSQSNRRGQPRSLKIKAITSHSSLPPAHISNQPIAVKSISAPTPQQFRPERYPETLQSNYLIFWMEELRPREAMSIYRNCPASKEDWAWNPDLFPLRVGATALQQPKGHYSLGSLCKRFFRSTLPVRRCCNMNGGPWPHITWSPWLCSMPGCLSHARRKRLRLEPQAPRH